MAAQNRRAELESIIAELSAAEAEALLYDWAMWSRPEQRTPAGDWSGWFYKGGRGTGKTRTGAEWIRQRVEAGFRRLTFVAATAGDVRDIMVEGESGLLGVFPESRKPFYEPSKRRVTFSTGAVATLRSADKPEGLRGLQHDTLWMEEPAAWRYLTEAVDMLMFGLRLGPNPQWIATSTPKPKRVIREWMADPDVHVTEGSTYDNLMNLAPKFIARIIGKYEGTRLGRQEIWAEVLEDIPGALWTRKGIEARRVDHVPRELERVVVAIDPPGSHDEDDSAEAGIVVAGLAADGDAYVLEDRSKIASPGEWAREVIAAYEHHHADLVVAEVNFGGDMVEHTIATEDGRVPVKVVHASKGKRVRAEPIANLFDPDKRYAPRAWFAGSFPDLEDQCCTFVPDSGEPSPDRMDAMVYAITELMLEPDDTTEIVEDDTEVRISRY